MKGLTLVALFWWCLVAPRAGQSPPTVAWIQSKPMRNVCVSQYLNFDSCNSNGTSAVFAGYEVQLFRTVASILAGSGHPEWDLGNYTFYCTGFNEALADLLLGSSQRFCDVFLGGVSVTAPRVAAGVQFTYANYQSGRRIMVVKAAPQTIWSFLDPLSTGVWLLAFGSSVAVGLVVLGLELSHRQALQYQQDAATGGYYPGSPDKGRQPVTARDVWHSYSYLQWSVTGMLLHGLFQLTPRSPGSRVALLGWAFVCVLLLCLYTSAYTAQMTVSNLKTRVSSMSDLVDMRVGIFVDDAQAFKAFSLTTVVLLPWNTDADGQNMVTMLRNHQLDALVLDAPFVDYETDIECDLYAVGQLVLPDDIAFALPADTPQTYMVNFDGVLARLDGQGVLTQMQEQYLTPSDPCLNKVDLSAQFTQITLNNSGGLWVFLASCLGLGMLWELCAWGVMLATREGPPVETTLDPIAPRSHRGKKVPDFSRQSKAPLLDGGPSDEAIQGLGLRLDQVDHLMKHLPFVITTSVSAALDEKLARQRAAILAEVRAELRAEAQARQATLDRERAADRRNSAKHSGTAAAETAAAALAQSTSGALMDMDESIRKQSQAFQRQSLPAQLTGSGASASSRDPSSALARGSSVVLASTGAGAGARGVEDSACAASPVHRDSGSGSSSGGKRGTGKTAPIHKVKLPPIRSVRDESELVVAINASCDAVPPAAMAGAGAGGGGVPEQVVLTMPPSD